ALKDVQRQFYFWCRAAEQQIASAGWLPDDIPGPEALQQWLAALLEQNRELAQAQHSEELRATAEETAQMPPTRRMAPGQTAYWQATSGAPSLRLSLASVEAESLPWTVFLSVVLMLVLGGLYGLAHYPRALEWVQFFWPEELAALGLLGWQLGVQE